ncbi:MAG: chorismate mutase [Christensenellaceae bacterium]|jgi:chorismate mutase/prephenate dehydratase|nr:chorismate mutase [Christensenellaceae bacterium]
MSDISKSRDQIDKIDDEIAKLYNKRMQLVKEIGQDKSRSNVNVFDGNREKAIINRVAKLVAEDVQLYTKQVYMTLFDTSKAYQSRFVSHDSDLGSRLRTALNSNQKFPDFANVACQGVEGSYSSIAAEKLFAISDITYFKNFDGVFNAVESGLCEYGVLPIENSTAGSVNAVYDLMRKHNFYIFKSIKLPVRHSLLAKKGINISDIKEIFSHEQALAQCNEYLKKFKNTKITICDNTAIAAKIAIESTSFDVAAIAAPRCAELYGLSTIENDIQDNDNNFTRFICISKRLVIFPGSNKISIMVNLQHEPGSLNRLLSKFTAIGLNLTKLESRPMTNTDFEFLFYFDFEGVIENIEVQNLIVELDSRQENFVFLGCYSEI